MSAREARSGGTMAGLNHNVRYQNLVFHLQTENSGLRKLEIVTQLFLGGNIVASARSAVVPEGVSDGTSSEALLRHSMDLQHKAMARALFAGRHDDAIRRLNDSGFFQPGVLADGERAPNLLVGGSAPAHPPAQTEGPVFTTRAGVAPVPQEAPAIPDAPFSDDLIVRHLALEFEEKTGKISGR